MNIKTMKLFYAYLVIFLSLPFVSFIAGVSEYYLQLNQQLPLLANATFGILLCIRQKKLKVSSTVLFFYGIVLLLAVNTLIHRQMDVQSQSIISFLLFGIVLMGFQNHFATHSITRLQQLKIVKIIVAFVGFHILLSVVNIYTQKLLPTGSVFKHQFLGAFYNPAIFTNYLLILSPFLWILLVFRQSIHPANRLLFRVGMILLAFVVYIIWFNQIRTGCLAFAGMGTYFFIIYYKTNVIKKYILMALVSICSIGFLLTTPKPSSTEGRWLILKVTWQMLKQNAGIGIGFNAYRRDYSFYQMEYFAQEKNQRHEILLADDNQVAHNEWLQTLAELGIIFGLILMALLGCLLKTDIRPSTNFGLTGLLNQAKIGFWIGLGILTMLSHPFRIEYTQQAVFLVLMVLHLLTYHPTKPVVSTSRDWVMILCAASFVHYAYSQYLLFGWQQHANRFLKGEHDQVYNFRQVQLYNNPLYLYTTAIELNNLSRYKESLKQIELLQRIRNDSKIEMLIGNNFSNLGDTSQAISHYKRASLMNPKLLKPIYLLMNEYVKIKDTTQAKATAQLLLSKPIKIPSKQADQMRASARQVLRI